MKTLIVLAATLLALEAAAGEQPVGGSDDKSTGSVEKKFEALDRDRDRALSKREANSDPSIATRFNSVDINLDGYISKSEYLAYLERAAQPR